MMDNVREKLVELLVQNEIEFMTYSTNKIIAAAIGDDPVDRFLSRAAFTADFLLSNGVTVQEWIPVTEPPKEWRRDNGEMINYLVYVPEFGVDIGNYGEPAKCWLCMGLPCKPTHWAHLPTPPKGE